MGRFVKRMFVLLVFACSLIAEAPGEENGVINLGGGSQADIIYGLVMTSFYNRSFDNTEGVIDAGLAKTEAGDPNRIRLAMALAKLGRPQAEKALDLIKGWDGEFTDMDEALRFASMGELNLYYLDNPGEAITCFETVIQRYPAFASPMFASLFNIYTGTREFLNEEKARNCLARPAGGKNDVRAFFNEAIFRAMTGNAEAREATAYYTGQISAKQEALKTYIAPAWGWLGDADKVVACLEPGLKEQAIMYAPDGFRLYCNWIRQSPAYDSIREDEKFTAMWERLYEYEPEGRGANIMMPMPKE